MLDLPRGRERERVFLDGETFDLRGSEVRTLATIGAFRVVPIDELLDDRGRSGDLWHGDLERLRSADLIRAIAPFDRDENRKRVGVAADEIRIHQLGVDALRECSHAGMDLIGDGCRAAATHP